MFPLWRTSCTLALNALALRYGGFGGGLECDQPKTSQPDWHQKYADVMRNTRESSLIYSGPKVGSHTSATFSTRRQAIRIMLHHSL